MAKIRQWPRQSPSAPHEGLRSGQGRSANDGGITRARVLGVKPSRRCPAPYPLVLVEWEDSARPIADWQWADDYVLPEIVRCVSVGYLIADTKTAVALAPNLGDVGHPRVQMSGIIRIPRSAVVRISEASSWRAVRCATRRRRRVPEPAASSACLASSFRRRRGA